MRGLMRARRACIAAMAAAVCVLAGANTASAVVPGGVYGANCVSSTAVAPCATIGANLGTPNDIAIAPDSSNVYVVTSANSLLTFSRDAGTGALTQIDCIRNATGCRPINLPTPPLAGPSSVVVSPDGASVYVANSSGALNNDYILQFDRGPGGILSLKPAGSRCIANAGSAAAECTDGDVLVDPQDMAVAGNNLYVASSGSGGVAALTIGAGGGLVRPNDSAPWARCLKSVEDLEGCPAATGLAGARAIAAVYDRVYVATNAGRVVTMQRDPSSGLLRAGGQTTSCVGTALTGCTTVPELANAAPTDLALTADSRVVVALPEVAGTQTGRVLTLTPSGTGLVRQTQATSCVHNGAAAASCSAGRALGGATPHLAATADGQDVYVASSGVLELDQPGSLTARGDLRGCVAPSALAGCSGWGATLTAPTAIAASGDGKHVYVGTAGRIVTLRRDSSGPVCDNVAASVNHGSVQPLTIPCFDPDGDLLQFTPVNPPTLGTLGAFNHDAKTIIYAAPLGQNGSTTMSFRAVYRDVTYGAFQADGSIQVHVVGAPVVVPAGVDADGDGFTAGQDCNDNNRNIRPGAAEIKGNNIDENCDGVAEPFPTLASGVLHNWSYTKRGTTFTLRTLKITQQFPKGWKVTIKCSGKKCPFKSKTLKASKVKKAASSVIASLSKKQRRFRVGQTVEIWVSAPNFNTKVARITLKRGKQPAIVPYCVLPGSTKVQKTCT